MRRKHYHFAACGSQFRGEAVSGRRHYDNKASHCFHSPAYICKIAVARDEKRYLKIFRNCPHQHVGNKQYIYSFLFSIFETSEFLSEQRPEIFSWNSQFSQCLFSFAYDIPFCRMSHFGYFACPDRYFGHFLYCGERCCLPLS